MITQLLQYFSTLTPAERGLLMSLGFVVFWLFEALSPFRASVVSSKKHIVNNLFFAFSTAVVNIFMAVFILGAVEYADTNQIGLLHVVVLDPWLQFTLGILVLDFFTSYLIHVCLHKSKWLWRIHLVHHSYPHLDSSTAIRLHPFENLIRIGFLILTILLFGIDLGTLFFYQTVAVFFSQLGHANLRLPKLLNSLLSVFFVTPNMHQIHHHYEMPYTDSNYGSVFAIWDHLFGTYRKLSKETLKYGLDTHQDQAKNINFLQLLIQPFRHIRR